MEIRRGIPPEWFVNPWLTEAEVTEVKSRLKPGLSKLEYNAIRIHKSERKSGVGAVRLSSLLCFAKAGMRRRIKRNGAPRSPPSSPSTGKPGRSWPLPTPNATRCSTCLRPCDLIVAVRALLLGGLGLACRHEQNTPRFRVRRQLRHSPAVHTYYQASNG